MIKIENIQKSFGKVEVLKGINILIHKGEIVSITGPSGAGKSTLLQIIGTLDKADQGECWIGNTHLKTLSGKKLAEFRNKEIGFVFQFHHLLPEFNAIENIMLPALIGGKTRNEALKSAKDLLLFFGLQERGEHKPFQLSGGEQQRVAVARALINQPSLILADEPSGNLDSANAEALHTLFFKLREEFGQTYIIVTHNEKLAEYSDRCLLMKDGLITEPKLFESRE